MPTKNFYTVKDVAEEFQVQEKTVRQLITDGKLKAKKILNKWIVSHEDLKQLYDNTPSVESKKAV